MVCYILVGISFTSSPISLLQLNNPSLSVLPLSQGTFHFPVSLLDHLLKGLALGKKLYYLVPNGKGGSDYMFCDRMLNWYNKNSKAKYLERNS